MKKKSSKRSTGKAKKPRAATSRQKAVDTKKDFWGDPEYLEHIELQKEIDEDIRQRLSRRPVEMQRKDFRLPESLEYFLSFQFQGWIETQYRGTVTWKNDSRNATEAAYMEGCRQGFIEGFVARLEPDRKRSAAGNAGKRTAPVKVGKREMTRDERDALMAAEYTQLVTKMKPTPACQQLAADYGFESWQGVAYAINAFAKRRAK